jgi:hypothetical protein
MKKLMVTTLLFVAAAAAFADDPTPDSYRDQPSLKSRAQVRDELVAARADGSTKVWADDYNPMLGMASTRSRAQVLAELAEARASGELGAMSAEDSGARYLARGAVPVAHSDTIVARHKP